MRNLKINIAVNVKIKNRSECRATPKTSPLWRRALVFAGKALLAISGLAQVLQPFLG